MYVYTCSGGGDFVHLCVCVCVKGGGEEMNNKEECMLLPGSMTSVYQIANEQKKDVHYMYIPLQPSPPHTHIYMYTEIQYRIAPTNTFTYCLLLHIVGRVLEEDPQTLKVEGRQEINKISSLLIL